MPEPDPEPALPSGGDSLQLQPQGYTKEELTQAITQRQLEYDSLQITLRQQEKKADDLQQEIARSVVVAEESGIVEQVTDIQTAKQYGQPIFRLRGQEEIYLQGQFHELQAEDLELLKRSKIILDAMLEEENMVILVITFAVVTVAVNAIRRLSVDYSWYIATGTGAMAYLAVSIAGSFINGGLDNLVPLVAGVAGAVVLTLVLQFFVFHVDYTKSEYLEYEDDEYHYYVKAVPKVVAANASESQERRRERQEQKAQQRAQREAEREARRAEKEQQAQEQRAQEEAAGSRGPRRRQPERPSSFNMRISERTREILMRTPLGISGEYG